MQTIQSHEQRLGALAANRTQGQVLDQYGNVIELWATNIAQQVTIGAAFQIAGVQVTTGQTGAGHVIMQALATGTITLTKGSPSATLVSTWSGTFTNGMVIGAADVSDPSSGVPTPAIVPGTTFTISGTAITLSQNAAESGTGLYCSACWWRNLESGTGWIAPTLLNSWTATNPVGYLKDPLGFVHLKGRISGGASSTVLFNLPAGYRPGNNGDDYAVAGWNGAVPGGAMLNINTAGAITVYYAVGFTDVGIGGITFLAEN